ncbi:ef hand family protein [Stylonychia lemnae]|uniref:Ef hand family protein n=1 Tax=Stylonychia lemnae TaxID=5949 RepID=A0A078BBQ0_STYLE|nr:ef hand family protein [Stylonychia lemnae]|eukprot:CDW91814.1 ef hand family protein [Stylonychia lemnae]
MSSNKIGKSSMLYDNLTIQDPRSKSLNSYSTQQSIKESDTNSRSTFGVMNIQDCLQILCDKIDERFKKVAIAFRFFDLRSTGKISFADFSYIVDQLQIRFNRYQVQNVFKQLDSDFDGFVTYNDFCELCEERRRQIDPFVDSVVKKIRLKESQSGLNGSTIEQSDGEEKEIFISKQLKEFKIRQKNLRKQKVPSLKSRASTQDNASNRQNESISPNKKLILAQQNFKSELTPSELSRKLKSAGAFGIPSDHLRKKVFEADQTGGDIKNILNYNYEKEYIEKAQLIDKLYQEKKGKQKLSMIGNRSYQGLNSSGQTMANKKRNENIQRRLKVINSNTLDQQLQSPKINISKQTYYSKQMIQNYLDEKINDPPKQKLMQNKTFIGSIRQNINNSFLEQPGINYNYSQRENSVNAFKRNDSETNQDVILINNQKDSLSNANNSQKKPIQNMVRVQRPNTSSSFNTISTGATKSITDEKQNFSIHQFLKNDQKSRQTNQSKGGFENSSIKRLNLELQIKNLNNHRHLLNPQTKLILGLNLTHANQRSDLKIDNSSWHHQKFKLLKWHLKSTKSSQLINYLIKIIFNQNLTLRAILLAVNMQVILFTDEKQARDYDLSNPQQDDNHEDFNGFTGEEEIKSQQQSFQNKTFKGNQTSRVYDMQIKQLQRNKYGQNSSTSRLSGAQSIRDSQLKQNYNKIQNQKATIGGLSGNIQETQTQQIIKSARESQLESRVGEPDSQVRASTTQDLKHVKSMVNVNQSPSPLQNTSVNDLAVSNDLLIKQRERQQKEVEVQLMMNRIKLLEQEEEKIKKKIDLTKKKATEIMSNKEINDQKQREKLQQQEAYERELEEQRSKNQFMKDQIKKEMMIKQKEIQERLINEARYRKQMKIENEHVIKENSQLFKMENKTKRDKVKETESQTKANLEKFRQYREEMGKGNLENRVEQENQKLSQADQILKQLEQREQAIIERLKHTQKTENKVRQMLVDAIQVTSTSKKMRIQFEKQSQSSQQFFNVQNKDGSKTAR